jgi:hypothetical protein
MSGPSEQHTSATESGSGPKTSKTAAVSAPEGTVTALDLTKVVPLALEVGWTIDVLFGRLQQQAQSGSQKLLTEHELDRSDRLVLETDRLECLLARLAALVPSDAHPIPTDIVEKVRGALDQNEEANAAASAAGMESDSSAGSDAGPTAAPASGDALHAVLQTANLELLESLSCASRQAEVAYQLGRSLRETVNPPRSVHGTFTIAVVAELSRRRIAKLQQWLASLADDLPSDSGQLVSTSLGRWSTYVSTVIGPAPGQLKPGASADHMAVEIRLALLDQGDVWLNLLTGAESTDGLLTPEGYVAAGEAALSRTVRIVRRVVTHYWVALFVLALALAAVLYISARYLGGAAKVWTQIAAIAGSLGITAKGIGSSVGRLSEAAERPIYRAEELDAKAWALTTLPAVRLNSEGVRNLRRAGIQGSQPLGRS